MHVLDEIDAAVRQHTARQQQLTQAQAEMAERRFTDEIPDVARETLAEVIGEQAANWIAGDAEPKPLPRGRSSRPDKSTDDYFDDKDSSGFMEEQPWLP